MDGFASLPDEGYSEDPLSGLSASSSFSLKLREDAVTALASARARDSFPPWLIQHISGLSKSRKTELAMAILNDLPTSVISQIVGNLYPRLYIDFIRYLPPEVCLRILEFLDPVSLINVARCCRQWHNLALDRKLWEQLYYLEGWKAQTDEIAAAIRDMNAPSPYSHGVLRRMQSQDDGHAHKKRAISLSPMLDADTDTVMLDAGGAAAATEEPAEMEPADTSIFGGPRKPTNGVAQRWGDVDMASAVSRPNSNSKGKGVDRGMGRAPSPGSADRSLTSKEPLLAASPRLAKSTLWVWDASSSRFKLNWKYLYTMRRRLESNWELGKYVNFQFPLPEHPEEGHGECVYILQFDRQYLVSGSRDRTIKVWDMKTRRCLRTLAKHRGSVLCLQFDSDPEEDLIVSGSSDSDVIIWRLSTGTPIQTLRSAHAESVLNVKFDKRVLVTCSKDKTIKIFNRKPLRHGELGYQVDQVGTALKDYGYSIPMTPDDYPVTPPWTMIGCLEGHSAAVNAVQIHDREIVSASGDRHIKVWDWPTHVCTRTIVGHNKGIACVQYDGRRIVSGSSDSEVKVFDRQTGLEVANLRAHSNLVRTVQAGFGDLPGSVEDDLEEAKKVDREYFKAVESGLLEERDRPRPGRRHGNAGSRRPEDICAYGAKLPPGGGGGRYGRIISGSYDASIVIWRRDKEGVWKDQHHFKQDTAAIAAMQQSRTQPLPPLHSVHGLAGRDTLRAMRAASNPGSGTVTPEAAGASTSAAANTAPRPPSAAAPEAGAGSAGQMLPPLSALTMELSQPDASPAQLRHAIDNAVQAGPMALSHAITAHPAILTYRNYVEGAIDRQQNPIARSRLRQTFSTALIRAQFEQGRQRREALRNQEAAAAASGSSSDGQAEGSAAPQPTTTQLTTAQRAAAAAHQAHAHVPPATTLHAAHAPLPSIATHTAGAAPAPPPQAQQAHQHHPHMAHAPPAAHDPHDAANAARVFKLQYDARRIICCSQRSVIVGWDFCNQDPELEEASRFFGRID
ncbi:hypothetical protein C8A05DRAFT_31786 [Staphylotrichum tortipilum]|uniref:F-box domain-containing protein n=1 Tax=Staphylotrichum tortipilum TaxID=2831512 RepID=A0AAN6RVL7_9PEZI|nr:hypothetical protein C8A05DRAFT_31786 [Staphylotrichum longicolle]